MARHSTRSKPSKQSVLRGMWRSASYKWRFVAILASLLVLLNIGIISLSSWYHYTLRDEPTTIGATFIPRYARHFGLDPYETLDATLHDLGAQHLRLVSYWDDIEEYEGQYDFTELDWQFKLANQYGAKVSLAIGLRQPRWPECHMPEWALDEPRHTWQPQLETFMTAVINRYKNNPALESYQLENEFFLKAFGICPDHSRSRLVEEYNLVKKLDDLHPTFVSRSNNALGWPVYAPTPDEYGVSVYKRVWDGTISHKYFEYPFPAQFYGALGAMSKITQGRDLFVHELQAEAWGPSDILDLPISEQDKTMDAIKLNERIDYGLATGLKRFDMWGVEYWYYRKVKLNEPSLWDTAIQRMNPDNSSHNCTYGEPPNVAVGLCEIQD